jgi:hypothetical protein
MLLPDICALILPIIVSVLTDTSEVCSFTLSVIVPTLIGLPVALVLS